MTKQPDPLTPLRDALPTLRGPLLGRQGWHFRDCWQFWAFGKGDARCVCSDLRRLAARIDAVEALDALHVTDTPASDLDVERLAQALAVVGWHHADARQQAETIAAEYTRLREAQD